MRVGWISYCCYEYIISSWSYIECGICDGFGFDSLIPKPVRLKEQSACHMHYVHSHDAVLWQHWHLQEGCLEFERTKWYDSLILYGLKEGETEDGLKQDPDLKLVPVILEKVLLPKLARKYLVHYDWYWQVVLVQFCLFYVFLSPPPPAAVSDI
jgi:hypothetical protein